MCIRDRYNFTLLPGSPCIDAGVKEWTINDRQIFNYHWSQYSGPRPDIGLLEFDITGVVEQENPFITHEFELLQVYPNPFNAQLIIPVRIADPTDIQLYIYNLQGQTIYHQSLKHLGSGYYDLVWNGTDQHGQNVSSGIYFIRLANNNYRINQKVILLK
mgnify:CR=1 FL=1